MGGRGSQEPGSRSPGHHAPAWNSCRAKGKHGGGEPLAAPSSCPPLSPECSPELGLEESLVSPVACRGEPRAVMWCCDERCPVVFVMIVCSLVMGIVPSATLPQLSGQCFINQRFSKCPWRHPCRVSGLTPPRLLDQKPGAGIGQSPFQSPMREADVREGSSSVVMGVLKLECGGSGGLGPEHCVRQKRPRMPGLGAPGASLTHAVCL